MPSIFGVLAYGHLLVCLCSATIQVAIFVRFVPYLQGRCALTMRRTDWNFFDLEPGSRSQQGQTPKSKIVISSLNIGRRISWLVSKCREIYAWSNCQFRFYPNSNANFFSAEWNELPSKKNELNCGYLAAHCGIMAQSILMQLHRNMCIYIF